MDLFGKTIVVTGSEGLLGKYITTSLTNLGAECIRIDKTGVAGAFDIDIARASDIERLFACYNAGSIYGIVNNAAISYKGKNTTEEQFNAMLDVNICGTNNVIKHITGRGLLQSGGSIVNIGSVYGMISPDFRIYDGNEEQYNPIAYGISKAAIIQMTKYYAVLLAEKKIRVNTVSPSGIFGGQDPGFMHKYSERVPERRMVEPQEVVNVILFLLSSKSSGINGANIPVTAGMDIW